MKKMMIAMTVLSALACLTGCGTEISTADPASTAAVSQTEETTAAAAPGEQTVSAARSASAPAVTSESKQTDSRKITLDESKRLFGGYVSTRNSAALNLRSLPDIGSDVLIKIPDATQLSIYDCGTKGWYLTSYKGKTGYVSAEYIKKIEDDDGAFSGKAAKLDVKDLDGAWNCLNPDGSKEAAIWVSGEDGTFSEMDCDTTAVYTKVVTGTVKAESDGKTEWFAFYDEDHHLYRKFTPDAKNPKEYRDDKPDHNRLVNATGFAKPNADGFYDDANLPAASVSVAALNGVWTRMSVEQTPKQIGTMTISKGSDIYHGTYQYTDANGKTVSGKVQIQYLISPMNDRSYCYTFYQNSGKFDFALNVVNTVQCDDLSGYQSGDPHFVRAE